MQDLPNPATRGTINNQQSTDNTGNGALLSNVSAPVGVGVGISKETEVGGIVSAESPALAEVGKDIELPKEVRAVGVKIHPTSVSIPAPLGAIGIKGIGQNATTQTTTVALPLTDDQIARGLHQSIVSSWRWLAEWCWRRLKQMHVGLKMIHGKLTRVGG